MIQVIGKYPETIYGWRGAFTGVSVEEFVSPDKGGMLFVAGLSGPEQILTANEHGSGLEHMAYMREMKYFSSLLCYIRDENHGRVRWINKGGNGRGQQRIEWQLARADVDKLKRATGIASRILFAGGAEKVYLPTFQQLLARSVFELDKQVDQIDYGVAGMFTFRVLAVGAQGTARMGRDPETSVVNPRGETHEVTGLFVADASVLPSNPGVQPQMAVSVMANYIADTINANERDYFV
jgi:hypothetical protein